MGIHKNGEKVDWYGIEVPKDLLTKLVVMWSAGLKTEIDKLESSLSDFRGVTLENKKSINIILNNNEKLVLDK